MKKGVILFFLFTFFLVSCKTNNEDSITKSNMSIVNSGSIVQKSTDLILTGNLIVDNSKKVILKTNNLQLSDEKINEFIVKMEKMRVNSIQGPLVQGYLKAEYIPESDYIKADFISITQGNKQYTIAGPYMPDENKEYIDCMKDNNQSEEQCHYYKKGFNGFVGFSPSGYYLMYYKGTSIVLVNAENGKAMKDFGSGIDFLTWTPDKKQLVYGQGNEYPFQVTGLYITKKGNFPEIQELLPDYIQGLYVDENYIYIKSIVFKNGEFDFSESNIEHYFKIINLQTLQVIFVQEL